MPSRNVMTKKELIDVLNDKCRKAKVYRYGEVDELTVDLGGDVAFFTDRDVKEDNGLSFVVEAIVDTAKDRGKMKHIFETVAKERNVAFDGKRSRLEVEKCEHYETLEPYWSFTWYFSPNE